MILFLLFLTQVSGNSIVPIDNSNMQVPDFFLLDQQTLGPIPNSGECLSISKNLACFSLPNQGIDIVYFNQRSQVHGPKTVPEFSGKASREGADQVLFCRQWDLQQPFCFTKEGVHIFHSSENTWAFLPQKPIAEFTYPSTDFSGKTELNVQFPYLISLEDQKILAYNATNGTWTIFNAKGRAVKTGTTSRKAHPIRVGKSIAWLNMPEKGSCKTADLSNPLKFNSSVKVPELSRYSLIQRGTIGFWVISFPLGLRTALDAWDTGYLSLWLTFVSEGHGKVLAKSQKLNKAPLCFELTVSRSGSPKLKASPAFKILHINNSSDLALQLENSIVLFSSKGQRHFKATSKPHDIILLEKNGQRLRAWQRDGSSQILSTLR